MKSKTSHSLEFRVCNLSTSTHKTKEGRNCLEIVQKVKYYSFQQNTVIHYSTLKIGFSQVSNLLNYATSTECIAVE